MLKRAAIIISPNWRDYAKKYLAECVASISRQDYAGELKIFISDNESTDESYGYLKSVLKEMDCGSGPAMTIDSEIIINKNNDGFAKGNNDAIKLALEQGFPYIILFNMDTVLEKDCITQMIKTIDDEKLFLDSSRSLPSTPIGGGNDREESRNYKKEIGAVQARIMLYDDKEKINSLGNVTHFLGFGYSRGYGEEYVRLLRRLAAPRNDNYICYPSGAAVLFKARVLKEVGLFDEEFWLYNEDQDLGWRIWLAGFSCVLASRAVVYHKYQFHRSIKKYYFMDRNRIIAIIKNYHLATLLLIVPALLAMEIGLMFFAFKGGWLKEKIKVYKYFLSLKNWRYLWRARERTQALRRVKDKEIIKLFSGRIWYQEIGEWKLEVANVIFNSYWRVVKVLIRW